MGIIDGADVGVTVGVSITNGAAPLGTVTDGADVGVTIGVAVTDGAAVGTIDGAAVGVTIGVAVTDGAAVGIIDGAAARVLGQETAIAIAEIVASGPGQIGLQLLRDFDPKIPQKL